MKRTVQMTLLILLAIGLSVGLAGCEKGSKTKESDEQNQQEDETKNWKEVLINFSNCDNFDQLVPYTKKPVGQSEMIFPDKDEFYTYLEGNSPRDVLPKDITPAISVKYHMNKNTEGLYDKVELKIGGEILEFKMGEAQKVNDDKTEYPYTLVKGDLTKFKQEATGSGLQYAHIDFNDPHNPIKVGEPWDIEPSKELGWAVTFLLKRDRYPKDYAPITCVNYKNEIRMELHFAVDVTYKEDSKELISSDKGFLVKYLQDEK